MVVLFGGGGYYETLDVEPARDIGPLAPADEKP